MANRYFKVVAGILYIISGVSSLPNAVSASPPNPNLNRNRRHASDNKVTCILPPHPKNGLWILQNGIGREGEQININSILVFECRKGHKLSTKSPYVICDKNWDVSKMPECLKLCPEVSSTATIAVKCTNKKGDEVGCHEATQDTFMSYTCAPFYEAPFGYKTTSYCLEGEWNSPPPICQPICGKKVHDDVTPLIFGGKVETVIEYPWIAVLYKKMVDTIQNVCGGSIINQKLVLTAAHCVTNNYGDALDKDNFLVAAGKLFNKYQDSRDINAQYLELSEVIVHPKYKGDNRRYQADIAVLVTKERFILNKFVQPVCFNNVNNINLKVGNIGVVAGYGIKEGGVPSEELRTLEIPHKSESKCAQELPGEWGDRYYVIDKLCAGFYNRSMGICPGDSGNGFFFRNSEDNRYYIHGVVSLGQAKRGQCNVQQNALYTKVAYHYDFVDQQLTKYYIKDCKLPLHPENGRWTVKNVEKYPGDTVPSSTVLEISCQDGYKLSSSNSHITCESSFLMPTCDRLCPPVKYNNIEVTCTTKGGEEVHCNDATEGTVLTYSCGNSGFKIPDGTANTRECTNGAWESPPITCERIQNGTVKEQEEEEVPYPKVVCLYDGKQYEDGVKPEDLDATLCNYVIYDSVRLSHDGDLRVKRENGSEYRSVADMKNRNRKLKVLLSVYGKGQKEVDEYPTVAGDPIKRNTFVGNVIDFLETYNFDGINVHWDIPQPSEKETYLQLLRDLKTAFEPHKWLVTVTVYFVPTYLGYSPTELHLIVDWINLGSYEFYDEWSKYTGQNSALYPSPEENDNEQTFLSIRSTSSIWSTAGPRPAKISIGVAFFGRFYTLKNPRKHGLHAPVSGSTDANHTGLVSYAEICEKYKDWTRVWDDVQKNPYKYNKNKWLGYDDTESIKLKAAYAETNEFFGVTVNSVDKDDVYGKCGPKQALLKYVHAGLQTGVALDPSDNIH